MPDTIVNKALQNLSPHYAWLGLAVMVFCLPPLLGDIGTVFILLHGAAIGGYYAVTRRNGHGVSDMSSLFFLAAFLLLAGAFAISARSPSDIRYIFNFAPLLISIPTLWWLRERGPVSLVALARLAGVGAFLGGGIACIQVFGMGSARAGWHVINAIHFANVSLTLGFFSLAGVLLEKDWKALLYAVPMVAALVACILAATRGPLLTALIVLPLFLAFLFRKSRRQAGIAMALAGLAMVVFGLLAAVFAPQQLARLGSVLVVIPDAIVNGTTGEKSTDIRLMFLNAGLEAFRDAPVFGHGWMRLVEASRPYVPDWLLERSYDFNYLHNEPLDFAVGAGIFGLLAYGLILVAPVAGVLAAPKDRQFPARLYLALMLSIAFLAFGLTSRLLGHALQQTLYVFMTAFIVGFNRPPTEGPRTD